MLGGPVLSNGGRGGPRIEADILDILDSLDDGTLLAATLDVFETEPAVDWTNSHLHQFEIGGLRYGDPDLLNEDIPDDFQRAFDAGEVRLHDFHLDHEDGLKFAYLYDFDSWRHTVALQKLLAVKPTPKTATCIEGARCCPPEDVGGPHGYAEFLRVLLSPEPDETEEQRHLKRWSGGKFDPERFDVAKTDKAVRGALRKRREQ